MKKYILMLLILSMMTSSLNISYADSSTQTSPNTPPIRNYMACILTKWAFEYHGMIPLNILFRYFSDMDTACNPSTAMSSQEESDTNTSTEEISRYPGCDTDDIVLDNGQVWSACNVGATKSYKEVDATQLNSGLPVTDTSIAGRYFSWGELDGWGYNTGGYIHDTILHYSDVPLIILVKDVSLRNSLSYYNTGSAHDDWGENEVKKGPCDTGYHIPSEIEWVQACTYLTETDCTHNASFAGFQRSLDMQVGLKLAPGGIKIGPTKHQDEGSYYWTSTSYNNTIASVLGYGNSNLNIGPGIEKTDGLLVRCIKD